MAADMVRSILRVFDTWKDLKARGSDHDDYISTKLVSRPYPKSQMMIRCEIEKTERIQTPANWSRANNPGSTYLIQTRAHGLCPVSHDTEHSARMQVGKIVQQYTRLAIPDL